MPYIANNRRNSKQNSLERCLPIPKNIYNKYNKNKITLYKLIEETIKETINKYCNNEEFFDRFVEIKEVSYGERNFNTNY